MGCVLLYFFPLGVSKNPIFGENVRLGLGKADCSPILRALV